jgi:hypothetical protein
MRKWRFLAICLNGLIWTAVLSISLLPQQKEGPAGARPTLKPDDSLPAALDGLYPPAAKEPVFLIKMIRLAESFSGTVSDLLENDLPNAQANFQKFRARYGELSGLVPDWKSLYPMGPVEELGAFLKAGDQPKVIAAFEKVGGVCTACHIERMARVQFRYGWPDFSKIRAKDPLTGEDVNLHRLMVFLDASLSGIGADLEQGQPANAGRQFQGFKARFDTMAGTCQECHGQDERKYYVGSDVRAMMGELEKAATEPSPEKAAKLVMGIGMESCHKCHLVHLPAAFAQKKWKR